MLFDLIRRLSPASLPHDQGSHSRRGGPLRGGHTQLTLERVEWTLMELQAATGWRWRSSVDETMEPGLVDSLRVWRAVVEPHGTGRSQSRSGQVHWSVNMVTQQNHRQIRTIVVAPGAFDASRR